jgi:5-methylcytosine-specific restriction protein A
MKFFGFTFFENSFFRYASRSSRWPKVREKHLSQNPHCAACGRRLNLEVHHIEPVHLNPERELDGSNLITLCSNNCHLLFGHLMDYKSWNINVKNDCSVYLNKIKNRPYK